MTLPQIRSRGMIEEFEKESDSGIMKQAKEMKRRASYLFVQDGPQQLNNGLNRSISISFSPPWLVPHVRSHKKKIIKIS